MVLQVPGIRAPIWLTWTGSVPLWYKWCLCSQLQPGEKADYVAKSSAYYILGLPWKKRDVKKGDCQKQYHRVKRSNFFLPALPTSARRVSSRRLSTRRNERINSGEREKPGMGNGFSRQGFGKPQPSSVNEFPPPWQKIKLYLSLRFPYSISLIICKTLFTMLMFYFHILVIIGAHRNSFS